MHQCCLLMLEPNTFCLSLVLKQFCLRHQGPCLNPSTFFWEGGKYISPLFPTHQLSADNPLEVPRHWVVGTNGYRWGRIKN